MPPRRVTRRDSEAFMRRLEGKTGAERERLVKEHQEYIAGTRDRDADFGNDEQSGNTVEVPSKQGGRPRTTVIARDPSPAPQQRKGALSRFYNTLAKTPRLHGKAPAAALHVEELAEAAASAEEEDSDDNDEDYVDTASPLWNDDAEFDEAIIVSAPVTPAITTKKSTTKAPKTSKGKGKRKRVPAKDSKAAKAARTVRATVAAQATSPHVATSEDASSEDSGDIGSLDIANASSSPEGVAETETPPSTSLQDQPRTSAARSLDVSIDIQPRAGVVPQIEHQDDAELDDGALDSEYEGSDAGSAEWYDEVDEGDNFDEISEYDPSEESSVESARSVVGEHETIDAPNLPPARRSSSRRPAPRVSKEERARWKDVIDNWRAMEGQDLLKLAHDSRALKRMRQDGWESDPSKFPETNDFPGLYDGMYGPSDEVMERADSPLELYLYFLPRTFWLHVERESNRYYESTLMERMEAKFRAQGEDNRRTLEEILATERRIHPRIKAHEILQCLGLLLGRMLCPHTRRVSDHWATSSVGVVPLGTLGRILKRDRFERVMRYLHFSDNAAPEARRDKAWKVRPIVDTLQKTFLRGYKTPPVLSFDEAMVPSRSRYNPMRQFMKDKPHRWGTKVFMTCCAQTAYCLRSLLHVRAECAAAFGKERVYSRHDPDKEERVSPIAETAGKKRPKHIPRGTTQTVVSKAVPQLSATVWFDNTIVYVLATGSSHTMWSCERRLPHTQGQKETIPCPAAVKAYHRWMGGVDVHDQLRLQRYSLQLSLRFCKYYKGLAFGLFDMAIVNCYIIQREVCKMRGNPPADHASFISQLHAQLVGVGAAEFANTTYSPGPATQVRGEASTHEHKLEMDDEWVEVNGIRKRRQRQCKVCTLRKTISAKRQVTRFYCPGCSKGNKRIYLCDKVRQGHYPNNTRTCYAIWHELWHNGTERPQPRCSRGIQLRAPGKKQESGEDDGDGQENEIVDGEAATTGGEPGSETTGDGEGDASTTEA